jgi:hypothetical protein
MSKNPYGLTNEQMLKLKQEIDLYQSLGEIEPVTVEEALRIELDYLNDRVKTLLEENRRYLTGLRVFTTDRWSYWPPRSGEVHCKWCGNRFWVDENDEPLEDIDNRHDTDCPFVIARAALGEGTDG